MVSAPERQADGERLVTRAWSGVGKCACLGFRSFLAAARAFATIQHAVLHCSSHPECTLVMQRQYTVVGLLSILRLGSTGGHIVPWTRGHAFFGILDHAAGLVECLSFCEACTWGVSSWRDAADVIGCVFRRRPSRRCHAVCATRCESGSDGIR
jgi:hypothetical protein